MRKSFVKAMSLAVCAVTAFSFAGCVEGQIPEEAPEIVGDFEMVALEGDESIVTILRDGGLNVDEGFADIMVPKKSAVIGEEYEKSPSVALPYLFTKALHNDNVTYNNIRLQYFDWGWGDPLMQKSEAAFKAGAGVDIMIGESQMPGYAQRGLLKPFPEELAAYVRETMHPAAYKAMEMDLDNDGTKEIYGVAANPAICTLVWNKDVLRKCKVEEKYIDHAPATWEEFVKVCEKVSAEGGARYSAGGMYAGNNYGGHLRMAPFVAQAGGWYVDDTGALTFNDTRNAKALTFLREISRNNLPAALIPKNEEVLYTRFTRGQVAYLVDGSWRISMAKENNVDVGFGALPSPTGTENKNVAIGAAYLCVPDYTVPDRAENAFKVIKSHCSEYVQSILMNHGIRPVSRIALAESDAYAAANPVQSAVYRLMKSAEIMALPSFVKDASKIWGEFGEAQEKAADEEYYSTAIQALLNEAQTDAAKFVK